MKFRKSYKIGFAITLAGLLVCLAGMLWQPLFAIGITLIVAGQLIIYSAFLFNF